MISEKRPLASAERSISRRKHFSSAVAIAHTAIKRLSNNFHVLLSQLLWYFSGKPNFRNFNRTVFGEAKYIFEVRKMSLSSKHIQLVVSKHITDFLVERKCSVEWKFFLSIYSKIEFFFFQRIMRQFQAIYWFKSNHWRYWGSQYLPPCLRLAPSSMGITKSGRIPESPTIVLPIMEKIHGWYSK